MSRRKTTEREEPVAEFKPSRSEIKKRQLRVLLFSIAGIIILAVAAAILYQSFVAPFRKPVLTVDGNVVRMQYFLNRARLTGDPSATVQQLAYEEVVKLAAPELGITISESAIDAALQEAAAAAASDNSTQLDVSTRDGYDAWYKQQLKESGFSSTQYRDMVRSNMIVAQIQQAIAANIPAKGEQVHLHVIIVANADAANKAKARLDKGEDFAAVAKEVSIDAQSKSVGGDVGWIPKGVLPYDDAIFALEVGEFSAPVATNTSSPTDGQYLLFSVSEKEPDRDIDEAARQQIGQNAFYYWLQDQISKHEVAYNLTTDDQAWVDWQLAKVRK